VSDVARGGGGSSDVARGGRCMSSIDGEADPHPTLFGEADARPVSLGWWRRVRHCSGKRMSVRRQRGGRCVSSGGWERPRGRVEASGAAQC
jgi:hypothetical protein